MSGPRLAAFGLILLLAACGKGGPQAPAAGKAASGAAAAPTSAVVPAGALLLAPEDVLVVRRGARAMGPVISGSIQPERRADLRAEIAAVVLQVLKENGESVRKGELLMRLDDSTIRETLNSADETLRAATRALEQAERQVQRLKTLQAQGMTSLQQLEDAEIRRNNAQSDMLAAKARESSARQQLTRTEVRAPFDGVVSDRKASAGDTALVGKELVKVIDPASMRLQGLVSADRMHEIRPGQKVRFNINGYAQGEFTGVVKRVDAAANAVTRQVEVIVAFGAGPLPRVSGLYAEGMIETDSAPALALPESAIVRDPQGAAQAWRLGTDGKLARVTLKLGERDERSGEVVVAAGLAEGERILRRPGVTLVDGQAYQFAAPGAAAASASAAASNPKRP